MVSMSNRIGPSNITSSGTPRPSSPTTSNLNRSTHSCPARFPSFSKLFDNHSDVLAEDILDFESEQHSAAQRRNPSPSLGSTCSTTDSQLLKPSPSLDRDSSCSTPSISASRSSACSTTDSSGLLSSFLSLLPCFSR